MLADRGRLAIVSALLLLGMAHPAVGEEPPLNAVGPPLTTVATKIADPNWLVAWLMKPSKLRPGTTMPDFDLPPAEAQAVARYLYSSTGAAESGNEWRGGDVRIGEKLFVGRGCRGCHAVAPAEASISLRVPNLAGIGIKVRGDWLFRWLKSPRSYNPHTPMPQLKLTDEEIRHLVAFLLSRRDGADIVAAAPPFDPHGDSASGRTLTERHECASCHQIAGGPPPRPAFELASDTDGTAADAVLRNGRLLVAYYNCRGCHRIEGSGGAIAEHLEQKTLAPPTLEGEGARVQTSWLQKFLQQPTSLRPWLGMHMPNFGISDPEARALAKYFAALAGVPAADEPVPPASAVTLAHGLRRLAHFKCVQCHPTNPHLPKGVDPEDLSINLMLAKSRLRPSWMRQFLSRPKALIGPQTRMPSAFYTIDGTPKVEHPDQDIEAIVAYVLHMTEPLDAALAALEAERNTEDKKQQVDWSHYQY